VKGILMDIKELKQKIKIKEIISKYVNLTSIGTDRYRGCCPFHNETKPSFTVYSDTQSFYCYGCGIGGDVINFLMKIEKIDFKEAIRNLKKYL
jgi:DNA primase